MSEKQGDTMTRDVYKRSMRDLITSLSDHVSQLEMALGKTKARLEEARLRWMEAFPFEPPP